ncbi:helix-turn-helix domain-containing protein [Hymenobacter lucidus]|uniref:Helix-turn-helix domain-containing protein n=1 Tax=Hymenobacter lucidus TaxID=2880930 RepID=A0ABS8ATT9_9BACT|nr:helix-turn-helix domain-containing protein [Hymenobacter lucidus]MCB2409144.1 helix-turn-helix domain-containing protein [Hymenobacter lucidus]
MKWIPAKLRIIRQEFRMTQLELAQASGLSQRDISQLENGRKEGLPKEFIHFLHTRGVDLNWLFADSTPAEANAVVFSGSVKKYATAEDQPLTALAQEEKPVGYRPAKQPVASVPATISMVDEAARQHYPARHADLAFCQDLPALTLALPEVAQGLFRGFQVPDAAMEPALLAHDWVIAHRELPTAPPESGTVCVVVTKSALHIRRVFGSGTNQRVLLLRADAGNEPETECPLTDIVELWSMRGRLSFQLTAAGQGSEQKTATLEASLQDLLSRVQRLEQGGKA